MKKSLALTALLLSTSFGAVVYGQSAAPPGAGDKDLRDNNVKSRSVEMERIDRAARKNGKTAVDSATGISATAEDRLSAKYGEIKTNYEQIQLSQDAVVKNYQGSDKIDYAQIGKFAAEINKSAVRLHSNLFFAEPSKDSEVKSDQKHQVEKENEAEAEKDVKSVKGVRDLIVDLDRAIGNFATSAMFQNLRTVDAEVSAKAKIDLEKIVELSRLLAVEAGKMSKAD